MNDPHPARSSDFLSRLHDGEVPSADSLAFESHRAACVECREAADAFARSLAAFRSAEPSPAAADLSARILRKIRAQSPSRRPFGVTFGIDIRWAGVFVAALLVVLMSAPALLRRPEAAVTPEPASIPARILDAPQAAEPAPRPAAEEKAAIRPAAPAAKAPSVGSARDEAPQPAPSDNVASTLAAARAPAGDAKTRSSDAAPEADALAAAPRAKAAVAESARKQGGAAGSVDAAAAPPRLAVRALDGEGAPPALPAGPPDARLAALRGREFVLLVEADGRVREVLPPEDSGLLVKDEPSATRTDRAAGALDALRSLRFAPGDRSRRLLVGIE